MTPDTDRYAAWADEELAALRERLIRAYRDQDEAQRMHADLGGGRKVLLDAAKGLSAAWNSMVEKDEDMDGVIDAVGKLRRAIELAETPYDELQARGRTLEMSGRPPFKSMTFCVLHEGPHDGVELPIAPTMKNIIAGGGERYFRMPASWREKDDGSVGGSYLWEHWSPSAGTQS